MLDFVPLHFFFFLISLYPLIIFHFYSRYHHLLLRRQALPSHFSSPISHPSSFPKDSITVTGHSLTPSPT